MRVVRSVSSILVLVSCIALAAPASAQTFSPRKSSLTFIQPSVQTSLGQPSSPVALFRQGSAAQNAAYAANYGAVLYFGFLLMHFDSYSRHLGFELGYMYALSELFDVDVFYGVSHRGIGTSGGAYGGDNLISVMGGFDYQVSKTKSNAKTSVGVVAGLDHEFGENAFGLVPQVRLDYPLNKDWDFYAHGGFKMSFFSGVTAKGVDAAFGVARNLGK